MAGFTPDTYTFIHPPDMDGGLLWAIVLGQWRGAHTSTGKGVQECVVGAGAGENRREPPEREYKGISQTMSEGRVFPAKGLLV